MDGIWKPLPMRELRCCSRLAGGVFTDITAAGGMHMVAHLSAELGCRHSSRRHSKECDS